MTWDNLGIDITADDEITTVEIKRGNDVLLAQALIVDGVSVYRPVSIGAQTESDGMMQTELIIGDALYLDETVTRVRVLSHNEFWDKVNRLAVKG